MSEPIALVFNKTRIRDDAQYLNLTDMWSAAGGDLAKQPSNWLSSATAREFSRFLAESVVPRNSGDIVRVVRGRNATTWAHWQLAMAYAKYLSPKFHAWCNDTVRAHMEGKLAPAITLSALAPIQTAIENLSKRVDEMTKGAQAYLRPEYRLDLIAASRQVRGMSLRAVYNRVCDEFLLRRGRSLYQYVRPEDVQAILFFLRELAEGQRHRRTIVPKEEPEEVPRVPIRKLTFRGKIKLYPEGQRYSLGMIVQALKERFRPYELSINEAVVLKYTHQLGLDGPTWKEDHNVLLGETCWDADGFEEISHAFQTEWATRNSAEVTFKTPEARAV